MNKNKHLDNLFELLRIPTISAQSEHNKDMISACKWLENKLKQLGFDSRSLPTNGHPVVYAENLSAGKDKPTILIYGHYDVQDPGDLKQWTSDPFEPEIRSGNIYCRGVADDKGQLYTWIAATEEITSSGKLPVNIKFLLEGEEEIGSVNIDNFVEANKSLLEADVCLISDSHCLSEEQPLIDYGLRGLVYVELKVKSFTRDVHSGMYGGNVYNPANVLALIISKLKNDEHKILIPGFYENVRELSVKEVDELAHSQFGTQEILEETGAKEIAGEQGFSVAARAGARPTLDINGIWGGYQGEGSKTIIPAEAGAKISMRIVPFQTSQEILEKFSSYVKGITPSGVDISIELLSTGEPILMNRESKYFEAAENAYKKVFGNKPVYELSGGSIPITATFKTLMDMDSVLMGYGLPDDGLHSPNEKMSLTMFEKGVKTNIEFLNSLK